LAEALADEGRRVVAAARATLEARWPAVETRVVEGDVPVQIVHAAAEWRADLVVLGARGLGALAGALLGSVSIAVARHAGCAVLVVKGEARPLRTALLALDGSPDSRAAARFFAALPLDPALRVRLLAVVEQPHFPSSAPGMLRAQLRAAVDEMTRERAAELERMLGAVESELARPAGTVKREVSVGVPGEAIVEAAREAGAELVVLGARGLGRFKRLLLGSVSERVLRQATCPVLVVKRHPEA
ncbi:MAG TPA: universal stress protein, partial [Methylomirabilota bacterium]|nr:universal stress protein [Methylomirabilota bacterium]